VLVVDEKKKRERRISSLVVYGSLEKQNQLQLIPQYPARQNSMVVRADHTR